MDKGKIKSSKKHEIQYKEYFDFQKSAKHHHNIGSDHKIDNHDSLWIVADSRSDFTNVNNNQNG